eukprot:13878673-Alexandrium_andersonii.AAC.1
MPPPDPGVGTPVSCTADSKGNGAVRLGGPRPWEAAHFASRWARTNASAQAWPDWCAPAWLQKAPRPHI